MGAPKRRRSAEDLATARPAAKRRRNATSKYAGGGKISAQNDAQLSSTKVTQNHSEASDDDVVFLEEQAKQKKKSSRARQKGEEKRLKRFRSHPPTSYQGKLERAMSQRMFVIDRHRYEEDGIPMETVELAGSTGNIYHVTIGKVPNCTCPDNQKGNQCKHIVYVLKLVLKAPTQLQYQLAFITSELREMFERSPLPNPDLAKDGEDTSNRKPVDGDCPICFMPFEPEKEEIIWCKAACGNNIHKDCFEQWAKSSSGREVKCVYCRTPWQGDDDSLARIKFARSSGSKNQEGYINVGEALGLSRYRDTSTYHSFWINRQVRAGETFETM